MTVQSQSKQGERDEPMTVAEFERWAEMIGLSDAQWSPVWYVIGREYDRGKLAGLAAKLGGGTRMSDQTPERHERLLADLAEEGAARCGYAVDVETWRNGRCDCKFIGPLGVADGSERTGCCEIRSAYWLLLGDKMRPRRARHKSGEGRA